MLLSSTNDARKLRKMGVQQHRNAYVDYLSTRISACIGNTSQSAALKISQSLVSVVFIIRKNGNDALVI